MRDNMTVMYGNKKRLYDRAEFLKVALRQSLLPLYALQVLSVNGVIDCGPAMLVASNTPT